MTVAPLGKYSFGHWVGRTIVVSLLLWLFRRGSCLPVVMLAADNLFVGIEVLWESRHEKSPGSLGAPQSSSGKTKTTKSTTGDEEDLDWVMKYTLYAGVLLGAILVNLLTWWYFAPVLTVLAVLMTAAPVQRRIVSIETVAMKLRQFEATYQRWGHLWLCRHFARLLNEVCQKQLGLRAQISEEELYHTFQGADTAYLWQFLKVLIANGLIRLMESPGKNVYTRIVKALYTGGHFIELPVGHKSILKQVRQGSGGTGVPPPRRSGDKALVGGFEASPRNGFVTNSATEPSDLTATTAERIATAEEVLRRVIIYRRWSDLCDPEVLNMLIECLTANPSNYLAQLLTTTLQELSDASLRAGAIMTFAMLFQWPSIWFPLVSFVLHLPWNYWDRPTTELRAPSTLEENTLLQRKVQLWSWGLRLASYALTWWNLSADYWLCWVLVSEIGPLAVRPFLGKGQESPRKDVKMGEQRWWEILRLLFPGRWTMLRLVVCCGIILGVTWYWQRPGWLGWLGVAMLASSLSEQWQVWQTWQEEETHKLFSWSLLGWGLFSRYHPGHLLTITGLLLGKMMAMNGYRLYEQWRLTTPSKAGGAEIVGSYGREEDRHRTLRTSPQREASSVRLIDTSMVEGRIVESYWAGGMLRGT